MRKINYAFDRGKGDGRNDAHNNPYHPASSDRRDYEIGFDKGASEKRNAEAND